jgi:hypothetical protein
MDKAEALDFIGLKEPLTEETVLNKYTERFNYYHMLYANAPSKVIEKIQQQNLEKLNRVKHILLEDIAIKKADFNKRFSGPVVNHKPEPAPTEKKEVVAWLIVHTENKKAETFELYEGVNYIGRKKKEDGANSIVLLNDPFVSRTHAFIKTKRINSELQAALYDGDGSKPSANGVFLNGRETRINQHCSLTENDTIQIGTTKLVFKIKKEDKSVSGEVDEVMRTDFIRTIDIK